MLVHLHPTLAVTIIPLLVTIALFLLPFTPDRMNTTGVWFGTPLGRRLALIAALLAMVTTPMWVIGDAVGLAILTGAAGYVTFIRNAVGVAVAPYIGGNNIFACFFASIIGAILYMPTLLEVAIVGSSLF